jgi:hypothetical protein
MKIFALADLPNTDEIDLMGRLLRLPEGYVWGRPEPIKILLCRRALLVANRQINWPLLRQLWFKSFNLSPLCEVYLEAKPCP